MVWKSMSVLSGGVYLVNRERLTKESEVLKRILDDDQKQLEALNILQTNVEQLQHPKSESLSTNCRWRQRSQDCGKYINDITVVLLRVSKLLVLSLQLCYGRSSRSC